MNSRILTILTFILTACGAAPVGKSATEPPPVKNDTTTAVQTQSPEDNRDTSDSAVQNMATYFVVVADTNLDYNFLRKEMFDLNRQLKIPIDTMGRFYNTAKNLIALPDNDDDEIYAGDYYPRRYPSEDLSLEYLDFYQSPAGKKPSHWLPAFMKLKKVQTAHCGSYNRPKERSLKLSRKSILVVCIDGTIS